LIPAGLVFAWKTFSGRRALLVFLAAYLAVWAVNVQYARYYVPLLPVVCAIAAAAAWSLSERRPLGRAAFGIGARGPAAPVPLPFLQYWNIRERVPLPLAVGTESREAFLSRALGGVYDAVQHLNSSAGPGDRAVTGGADAMRYYLKIPLASLGETFDL